ncbi:MAG: SDR family NAD(P)-dependent oxidoreductase [Spirochaetes bacterium]|nr:SDR family NAD(P)-dependent oxidoreductase [Spirochaetota bacterium]
MKSILITGADKGLGFSLAEKFSDNGYDVYAAHLEEKPDSLIELSKKNNSVKLIRMDVSSDESVFKAVSEFSRLNSDGSIDILLNNAGVHFEESYASLENVDFDIALRTHNINSLGPLRIVKSFLPFVKNGDKKLILNISSEAGSLSDCWREKEFDYCMSKAALNMQSILLQNYLKKDRIKVIAVHPGWMRTDMGGSKADIDSKESADGIFHLAEKDFALNDPIYMDYKGKIMHW